LNFKNRIRPSHSSRDTLSVMARGIKKQSLGQNFRGEKQESERRDALWLGNVLVAEQNARIRCPRWLGIGDSKPKVLQASLGVEES